MDTAVIRGGALTGILCGVAMAMWSMVMLGLTGIPYRIPGGSESDRAHRVTGGYRRPGCAGCSRRPAEQALIP